MTDDPPACLNDLPAARARIEAALDDPALCTEAHYLLWEICQACGDVGAALAHLDMAMRRNPLRTRHVAGAAPARSVLAIATPGDFQANLPVAMLLGGSTLLHVLWLARPEAVLADPLAALPDDLPRFDCVFIVIAEDSRHALALRAADALADALGLPTINRGRRIARLSRDGAARLLADVPGAVVPAQRLRDRAELLASPPAAPFIIRPRASHAGHSLARMDDVGMLRTYLAEADETTSFFVAPFMDFRSADGFFRKYRIVFVDRIPYPVHLAVHDDWGVWYYNAGMSRHAWKRAEEERFMTDMSEALGPCAMRALGEVGRRLDLDYVGLDCAVLPDGRLLVFEVETGMIVHDNDPADLFPYKKTFIPRVFAAVEGMIDARIAARSSRSPQHLRREPVAMPSAAS